MKSGAATSRLVSHATPRRCKLSLLRCNSVKNDDLNRLLIWPKLSSLVGSLCRISTQESSSQAPTHGKLTDLDPSDTVWASLLSRIFRSVQSCKRRITRVQNRSKATKKQSWTMALVLSSFCLMLFEALGRYRWGGMTVDMSESLQR